MNIFLNRINIFNILLYRIGIVEPEIAFSAIFLSHAEIEAYSFCVANMKIAVGLRRKTGVNSSVVLSLFQVVNNKLFDEAY